MVRLSTALMIVALVCGLTLALLFQQTAPVIERQKQLLVERSLRAVLSAERYEKYEGAFTYYEALNKEGIVLGWCLPLTTKGYGGKIELLAGVDVNGVITGVTVLAHNETPGLGSKIAEVEYGQTEAAFLKQFDRKRPEELTLSKDGCPGAIQAVTGATISSNAVLSVVRDSVADFLKDKLVL